MSSLSVLTLNIANPSIERAQRQLEWLASRDEDVFVLTETKASDGCRLLADAFQTVGYAVISPEPGPGEYGTMIASKIRAESDDWNQQLGYLPARAAATVLPAPGGDLHLIGLYVPSRDASLEKTDRKRRWFDACTTALTTNGHPTRHTLLLGDLNILEPDHQPRYNFFAPFEYDFYRALLDRHGLVDAFRQLHPDAREYSWVGRTGDQEETGIILDALGPCVWIRETRFHYRSRAHHRREHVFLARPDTTMPTTQTTPTENERAGLLGRRWWSHAELSECRDKLLPPALPTLLGEILAGQLTQPATLYQ